MQRRQFILSKCWHTRRIYHFTSGLIAITKQLQALSLTPNRPLWGAIIRGNFIVYSSALGVAGVGLVRCLHYPPYLTNMSLHGPNVGSPVCVVTKPI